MVSASMRWLPCTSMARTRPGACAEDGSATHDAARTRRRVRSLFNELAPDVGAVDGGRTLPEVTPRRNPAAPASRWRARRGRGTALRPSPPPARQRAAGAAGPPRLSRRDRGGAWRARGAGQHCRCPSPNRPRSAIRDPRGRRPRWRAESGGAGQSPLSGRARHPISPLIQRTTPSCVRSFQVAKTISVISSAKPPRKAYSCARAVSGRPRMASAA